MGFDKEILATRSADGRHVTTLEEFSYTTKAGEVIVIPAGTQSDGASTPRIFWRFLPPFGPYWLPALLHDFLYQKGLFPQPKCDRIFREAMLSNKVNGFKAWVIFTGVRIGGWVAYGNYRKKEKQK
jgi:hypothetical protein